MDKIYKSFKCIICNGEFILMNEQIKINKYKGKYESCPYCGSKRIKETCETDNLNECMKHGSWKKEHGVIRQVKQ